MKSDLLTAISEVKGVTDVVVMTHNIDFVFLQTLALRTFNRGGQPRITVFADAQCAQESFAAQHRLLSGLGTRYRVVPVAMSPGFRFHPKAVLLAGAEAATLFVGSGNLGFAGWRENAEVWVRFDHAVDGMAPFDQFREFAAGVINTLALNDGPRQVLSEIFDPVRNRWAASTAQAGAPPVVVGRVGEGPALLQALVDACDLESVEELVVCCPYYDLGGRALRSMVRAFSPSKTTLLYQPLGSTLSAGACEANPGVTIQHVGFTRNRKWGGPRQAFVHAKFYAVRQEDQVVVLAGSANCSVAALTLGHMAGNAELMAVRRVSSAEFNAHWLGALELMDAGDQPPVTPDDDDDDTEGGAAELRVLAARMGRDRQLLVAYAPNTATVTACLVDGERRSFEIDAARGCVVVPLIAASRTVEIEGLIEGSPTRSNLAWVDDEVKLIHIPEASPALDALKEHAQGSTWNSNAWTAVVDLFTKHVTQFPVPPARAPRQTAQVHRGVQADKVLYSEDDVLAPSSIQRRAMATAELTVALEQLGAQQHSSLPLLLRHWFARPDDPAADPETSDADPSSAPAGASSGDDDGDEEQVDAPTTFPKGKGKRTAKGRSDSPPGRSMQQVLAAIEEALATPGFCAHRPAHLLAVDLQLIALLLGAARREGWIPVERHLTISHVAWAALFLDGGTEAPRGWFTRRIEDEQERAGDFVEAFRSPQLNAAMLGWAYSCDTAPPSRDSASFELAAALALAQLPADLWLTNPQETAKALGQFVRHAACDAPNGLDLMERVRSHRTQLLELGATLHEVAAFARGFGYRRLLARSRKPPVLEAGDLLLTPNGYFIVRERTRTDGSRYNGVPTVCVSNPKRQASFDPATVLRVESLLCTPGMMCKLSAFARGALLQHLARLGEAYRPPKGDSLSL